MSKPKAHKKNGMLVLSRKPGEYVRILVPPSTEPTQIDVCLTDSYRDHARIGFRAPRETIVGREELYDRQLPPVAEAATDVTAV